jgi:hypothetical protein
MEFYKVRFLDTLFKRRSIMLLGIIFFSDRKAYVQWDDYLANKLKARTYEELAGLTLVIVHLVTLLILPVMDVTIYSTMLLLALSSYNLFNIIEYLLKYPIVAFRQYQLMIHGVRLTLRDIHKITVNQLAMHQEVEHFLKSCQEHRVTVRSRHIKEKLEKREAFEFLRFL